MLTDYELTTALRSAFADATENLSPRADLLHTVHVRHARRRRLVAAARITAPTLVLAAALTGLTLHTAGPDKPSAAPGGAAHSATAPSTAGTTGHARAGGSTGGIQLDGYIVALPHGFAVRASGDLDTNCSRLLHLKSGQNDRLITTPADGCPLLITDVTRSLPDDATRQVVPGAPYDGKPAPQSVIWYDSTTGSGQLVSYFPAKLPDGDTVYVSFAVTQLNYQQAIELANGLEVSPAGSTCTGPCG